MAKSKWHGKECLNHINNKLEKNMTIASNFVKDEAKRRVPIEHGNLKDSLTYEVDTSEGEVVGRIGSNVKYAWWVEHGAEYGKKPKLSGKTMPFLTPALFSNKKQIKAFLNK